MAGSGFLLSEEDAKKAVSGYTDCAGKAKATLRKMQNQIDDLMTKYAGKQATALLEVTEDLKVRINKMITDVDNLSSVVQKTATKYGSTDADMAQTFKSAVYGSGGQGAVYSKLTS